MPRYILVVTVLLITALVTGCQNAVAPAPINATYDMAGPPSMGEAVNFDDRCLLPAEFGWAFSGDLEGLVSLQLQIVHDGLCEPDTEYGDLNEKWVATGDFEGEVKGQEGTFDFFLVADATERHFTGQMAIEPDSGTGEFAGIRGIINFKEEPDDVAPWPVSGYIYYDTPQEAPVAEAAAETAPAKPVVQGPDAPPNAQRGPYAVGARDIVIEDGGEPVHITLWYPAMNPDNRSEEIVYKIHAEHIDLPGQEITGQALQDAPANVEDGPYPLVVYSPGVGGWSQMSAFLGEHLASHGFAIASHVPRESSDVLWPAAVARPMDATRIIAYFDGLSVADGEMAGLIDAERVAVMGHSLGAVSTLQSGGAQLDFSRCAADPDSVPEDGSCLEFQPHEEEIVAEWGLTSVPSGMWPQIHDPRVDAVVALAPDGDVWGAEYEGVTSVEIPALLMIGSGDSTIPLQEVNSTYEHLGSAEKALVVFEKADHTIFMNACDVTPWFPEFASPWVCSDAVWDMQHAHDLINHFTTAFLLSKLKDDVEADAALSPEEIDFLGVNYQAEGL